MLVITAFLDKHLNIYSKVQHKCIMKATFDFNTLTYATQLIAHTLVMQIKNCLCNRLLSTSTIA